MMSLASHRCCDRLEILKQAWIFSGGLIITNSGLCIYRKAINIDKPFCPLAYCLPGSRVLIISYEEGSEEKGAAMCSPFIGNLMMSDMTPYQ